MDYVQIKGYKSIKDVTVKIQPLNLLIGGNGAGKSNFLSFFEFLNNVYKQNLQRYTGLKGGVNKILYNGMQSTNELNAKISFNKGVNSYSFTLRRGNEGFIVTDEQLWYHENTWDVTRVGPETFIKSSGLYRAKYIREHLNKFRKYHFHETGSESPFNSWSSVENDIYFLYEKGENIAAFLYDIQEENQIVYNRIIKTIQSIAPFFSDFFFQPNDAGQLRLQWQSKYSDTIYGPTDLSDGTIRFIALTVLFMQPKLPSTIIIDEPELGLHPFAISKLAGMMQSAANKGTQVIAATQSMDLISYFNPSDIVTVDLENGESVFRRLNAESLQTWLTDYALGDLWKRNIIEKGQP